MKKTLLFVCLLSLFLSSAFAFTFREIKTLAPLSDQRGNPLANVPVVFTMVDANRKPADCWQISGERIMPIPATVKTNAFGHFSTTLVATSQCTEARYYLTHVDSKYAGVADFMAPLDAGEVSLDWAVFKAAGGTLNAIGRGVFAVHTEDETIHVTAPERAALDANPLLSASNGVASQSELNSLVIGGGLPASINTAGIAKLSTPAADPYNPIIVGTNDTRLHGHDNKTVLDALTDSGGTLQYNGSPIEGGAGGGHTIANASGGLPDRSILGFYGALVTVTDDHDTYTTKVTISDTIDGNSVTLLAKRVASGSLPASLPQGQFVYTTDTNKLYVGTGTGVQEITNQATTAITTHESSYNHANLPSLQEKSALVGSYGTPGGLNRYVTHNDPRMTDTRDPKSHQATHVTGADKIPDAGSGGNPGLMTAAQASKLNSLTTNGHGFQDEGGDLAQRPKVNIKGALVTATDNSGAQTTDITIANPGISDVTLLQAALDAKADISSLATTYQVLTYLSNNVAADGASTTKYPSVKAIKDYVDASVVSGGVSAETFSNFTSSGGGRVTQDELTAYDTAHSHSSVGLLAAIGSLPFDNFSGVINPKLALKVDKTITVNGQPLSGNVSITTITGNAATATALAADGTNCNAGYYPLGIDAGGNVQNCTAAGGMTNPMQNFGDMLYQGSTPGVAVALARNSTATRKFLQQVSSGIPAWDTIAFGDLPGPISYNPASLTVTYGTLTAGGYADLAATGGTDVAITEATSSNAIQATVGYTGVTSINEVILYGNYNGGANHEVAVEVQNFTTVAWDEVGRLTTSTAKRWYSYPLINGTDYISGGSVNVRFRHLEAGVGTHHLYLDFVQVRLSNVSGGGVTAHNSLTGRTAVDAHPAAAITNTPAGSIAATDTQSAINELDTEKEPANANIQSHISNTSNPHSVTAAQLGLGNVDNTSDANKPISTAVQAALDSISIDGGTWE